MTCLSRHRSTAADPVPAAGTAQSWRQGREYARKLTQQPTSVAKADAEAVLAAGWDETALYHTIAVTALFNFMNLLVEGAGIELDPTYVKSASERLVNCGYLPLIALFTKEPRA